MAYATFGSGTETIVFAPALGATYEMWRPQIEHFSPMYQVIALDGGGHPPVREGELHDGLDDFTDDLAAACMSSGALSFHFVGLSMGGMLGLILALKHHHMVRSLVVVSALASHTDEGRQALQKRADAAAGQGLGPLVESTLERWLTPQFLQEQPAEVEPIRQMLLSADGELYAQAARAVSEVQLVERLPLIASPTFIIRGGEDRGVSKEATQQLVHGIPEADFLEIPHASHLVSYERPREFNRAVERFIAGARAVADEGTDRYAGHV